jgi:hypothetical protein
MSKTPANTYLAMCNKLSDSVDFLARSPVHSPSGSPFDSSKLIDVVETNVAAMPVDYRAAYAQPLIAALPSFCAQAKAEFEQAVAQGQARDEAMAGAVSTTDTLVGAVRDWANPTYLKPLQRFEAVISNFYRSFLSDEQRSKIQLPLKEVMPPLATFAATGNDGPFTLPVDDVTSLVNAKIGIVSLPGSYREHPLLWPALAHETGGHDVVHADTGLEEELASGVRHLKGLPRGIGPLWSAWMDETVADVYGLLNVGPSFAVSLSAFFSSLEKAFGEQQPAGAISNRIPVQGGSLADVHPVDLLRLYLAQGVVSKLTALAPARIHAWQTLIGDVAAQAAGGKTTIDLYDIGTRTVVQSLPLAPMADAARAVGAYIACTQLRALEGHSIQDIETWDDGDEDAAIAITAALAAGQPIVALGDDAQLLAGATVAFHNKPADYAAITKALDAALDDSFARDPVFGKPSPHFMLPPRRTRATGRTYHRTLRSLASLGL